MDHEARRKVVTATEVPRILGVKSPGGQTRADIYATKRYGVEKQNRAGEAAEWGLILEGPILDRTETELGVEIVDRQRWLMSGPNGCTLDGRTTSGEIVEVKTAGICGPSQADLWGDPGTDQIPDAYLLQVQTQLLVTGAQLAWVAALIAGRGYTLYRVEPNERLQRVIRDESELFLEHVRNATDPGEVASLETLGRLRRQAGTSVSVPADLVLDWIEAKRVASDAEKRLDAAKAAVIQSLGDAEIGDYGGGSVTFFEQSRAGHVVGPSTFRVLRDRGGKR